MADAIGCNYPWDLSFNEIDINFFKATTHGLKGRGFFILVNVMAKLLEKSSFQHPVKLTALLYLQDALIAEEFESCKMIIQIAYEFGALDHEIEALLEDPRRCPFGYSTKQKGEVR